MVFDNEKVESFEIAYNDITTLSLAGSIYGEQLSLQEFLLMEVLTSRS